jgi:diacylglycerol kinase (ATP)
LNGLKILFNEKAAKREVFLLFFSIFYILIFKPKFLFALLLLILPFIILGIEAPNTVIEHLCNKITLKKLNKIKKI